VEFVFVVPRRELFPDHYPQGFQPFGDAFPLARLVDVVERHGFFVERARAEICPEWKQIIPYNVVLVGGEVLLLRRTARGGEARLHDKLTIGVGGHLNPVDLDERATGRNPLPLGTRRELEEELAIEGEWEIEPIGLMNDDSNPVGAVHVGVVQRVRVRGRVEIREKDVLEGRFVRPEELTQRRLDGANFETWSAKLVEHLSAWLPSVSNAPAGATLTPRASPATR
jgi:predicted NUDIX family phosphoesterase